MSENTAGKSTAAEKGVEQTVGSAPSPATEPKDPKEARSRLLDVLLEVQSFDRIPRLGFLQRGVSDAESVCEHSWHVAFLVSRLGRSVAGLDRLRAIELALEHDLAELRTGDLPRPVARHLEPGAKRALEQRVLRDLDRSLPGTSAAATGPDNSLEERFVKACDRLQLAVKAAAYQRAGFASCGDLLSSVLLDRGAEESDVQHDASLASSGFAVVDELLEELAERRSRPTPTSW